MLINKFGLTANDPYYFTVYEREVPLTMNLARAFDQSQDDQQSCAVPPQGLQQERQETGASSNG